MSPKSVTDPHTNVSPLMYPLCYFSHLLRVNGLISDPIPDKPIATSVIMEPAEQIVLEDVPNCSFPHAELHCLYRV